MMPGWSWPVAEVPDETIGLTINAKRIKAEASLMLFLKFPLPIFLEFPYARSARG